MWTRWIGGATAVVALAAAAAMAAVAPPRAPGSGEHLERGKFLIARPHVGGPYFHQSVILLLEYGPEGALGLIINRPTEIELSRLLPEVEALKDGSDRAFLGGPVEPQRVMFVFRSKETPAGSRRVTGDIHASGSLETLRGVLASGSSAADIRVYIGYSGWAMGQLEGEVARGDWIIAPTRARAVFEMEPERVWRELFERSFELRAGLLAAPLALNGLLAAPAGPRPDPGFR